MFMIDIAVPRNIDPEVARLGNLFLYNVDDLKAVVESNQKEREFEAHAAGAIISEELQSFARWQENRSSVPLIQALKNHTEKIRQSEIERFQGTLASLPPEAREKIEILTKSL
ncbi:glutamyl-tRNA reductase, partial [mine drainage metagenome]